MKSRLRILTVDGSVYRWTMSVRDQRTAPTESTLMQIRIWGGYKTYVALMVNVLLPQRGTIYVLPSEIRGLIAAGRAGGWDPSRRGPPVPLSPQHYAQAVAPILARYGGQAAM